jgi:hypothetical protein
MDAFINQYSNSDITSREQAKEAINSMNHVFSSVDESSSNFEDFLKTSFKVTRETIEVLLNDNVGESVPPSNSLAVGGKKSSHRKTKRGGADPSLAIGSPIFNISDLGIGSGASPLQSIPVSSYQNAPQAFSAGTPLYGSAEHGMLPLVTTATSGGLFQQGAGKRKSKTHKKK